LAVNLAVVKSKPVDLSAGFGFLMVPETGLEPVRMISPTVFKADSKDGQERTEPDLPHSDAELDQLSLTHADTS
jgi:hypothetical protein